MATPLACLYLLPPSEKQLSVRTSSARRSSVSELGSLTMRLSKKCLGARVVGNESNIHVISIRK